jgi:hypothetical protein
MRMLRDLADQCLTVFFRHPVARLYLFILVDALLEILLEIYDAHAASS